VIGRFCWLLAGAVLGVTGYRRASRLIRSMRPGSIARRPAPAIRPGAAGGLARLAAGRRGAAGRLGLAPFTRDVRDGMEMYLDRHSATPRAALEDQQMPPQLPGRAGMNGSSGTDNTKGGR
jgi:hypothetical protein